MRSVTVSAFDGLRTYWGTAALVVMAGVAALAALLPVTTLLRESAIGLVSRLTISPTRETDLGLRWSQVAQSATPVDDASEVRYNNGKLPETATGQ